MPKISAPTIAEHRSAQQTALLTAAEAILVNEGVNAVAPGAVAQRAGLARSTFYEYFASKDDLLIALARMAFEQWRVEVDAAMMAVPSGVDRLRVYVETSLQLAADGQHVLATALRDVPLSPRSLDDIAALHEALNDPLRVALADLVSADDRLAPSLIHGTIGAAMRLVVQGRPLAEVTERTTALLLRGLE